MEVLKVSSKSNPNSVAGALAGIARSTGAVEVQVVGAGALNQAIKAIAVARGYVETAGFDLVCAPSFAEIDIGGERRTAIRLLVERRDRAVIDVRESRSTATKAVVDGAASTVPVLGA